MNKNLKFLLKAALFCILLIGADRLFDQFMIHGLNRYYGLHDNADILIVGPSQIMLGLDKVKLEQETGMKVAKYTREGVNLQDRYNMLKHYFSSCTTPPKMVILSVDKYLFTSQGLSQNSYKLFFPFMYDSNMDKYIKLNASAREYWLRHVFHILRYDDILIGHTLRGYSGKWDNLKSGKMDLNLLEQEIKNRKVQPRYVCLETKEIQCFQDILLFLKKEKVAVILLDLPYAGPLENYCPSETSKVRQFFLDADNTDENIHYLYFQELSVHGDFYADMNHLNPDGQILATSMLVKCLKAQHKDKK